MADPVDGTVAPGEEPLPDWLTKDWEISRRGDPVHVPAKGEIPAKYPMLDLHDFRFLGQTFKPFTYVGFASPFKPSKNEPAVPLPNTSHTGTGVQVRLKEFLVDAQRAIFQAFARQQRARNKPVTDVEFTKWCGLTDQHSGWQPRDGKHRLGAAIDIDPLFNPYVATATDAQGPGSRLEFGGEVPRNKKGLAISATDRVALKALRQQAILVYDRALQFTFGDPTEFARVAARAKGETSLEVVRRFERLNFALRFYMDVGFTRPAGALDKVPRTARGVPRAVSGGPGDSFTMQAVLKSYAGDTLVSPATVAKADDVTFLTNTQKQMILDYEALRKVLISGKWTFEDGVQSEFDVTRDPRFGIMNLREEIVVALLDVRRPGDTEGLRWGAIGFGPPVPAPGGQAENGDMMHFDLGDTRAGAILNEATANGQESNGIFFGVPQNPPAPK